MKHLIGALAIGLALSEAAVAGVVALRAGWWMGRR
jgi:hypothetical protein